MGYAAHEGERKVLRGPRTEGPGLRDPEVPQVPRVQQVRGSGGGRASPTEGIPQQHLVLADFSGHLHCSLSSLRRSFADLAAAVIFLHCKCTDWNIVTSFIMWIFREVVKNMIICVMKRILHKNKVIFIQLQQFPILSYCLLLLCHKL